MVELNQQSEIMPLATLSVLVPVALMEEVAQRLHVALEAMPGRTFTRVTISKCYENAVLITGSVRTTRDQVEAVCTEIDNIKEDLGDVNPDNPFFRFTVSGFDHPLLKQPRVKLTDEEIESLTASRRKIVPTVPHRSFGIRIKK